MENIEYIKLNGEKWIDLINKDRKYPDITIILSSKKEDYIFDEKYNIIDCYINDEKINIEKIYKIVEKAISYSFIQIVEFKNIVETI